MKKSLLVLFGLLLISQAGISYGAASETTGIFQSLKNAIIRDVESAVQTTVTSAATKAANAVKISQYKQQLAQKKQDLADLEASNKNFLVKFFQRRRLNREINDLEEKIKELEKQ